MNNEDIASGAVRDVGGRCAQDSIGRTVAVAPKNDEVHVELVARLDNETPRLAYADKGDADLDAARWLCNAQQVADSGFQQIL